MADQETGSPVRKRLIAGAIALGTVFGVAGIAGAVTNQDSTPASQNDADTSEIEDDDDHGDGHRENTETPLTGTTADKVSAAALAAVPGGTIDRVETDDDGYEAHVTDADGAEVEVYFDQDLTVLEIK